MDSKQLLPLLLPCALLLEACFADCIDLIRVRLIWRNGYINDSLLEIVL